MAFENATFWLLVYCQLVTVAVLAKAKAGPDTCASALNIQAATPYMFVHLTPEKSILSIRRSGLKPRKWAEGQPRVVFAMPVLPDFYISHQWLRELKADGARTIAGVYFRLDDKEPVLVGHYNSNHREVASAEATGLVMKSEKPEGFEILIPRKILPSEIHKIRALPQVVGWRHYPGAHDTPPCGCPFCQPDGRPGSRQIRERYEQS